MELVTFNIANTCMFPYLSIPFFCLYVSISIYLFVLSVYVSLHFSVYISVYRSIYLRTYLFIYLSIYIYMYVWVYVDFSLSINQILSIYQSIYLLFYIFISYRSISLYIYLSINLFICLSINQSIYLPIPKYDKILRISRSVNVHYKLKKTYFIHVCILRKSQSLVEHISFIYLLIYLSVDSFIFFFL